MNSSKMFFQTLIMLLEPSPIELKYHVNKDTRAWNMVLILLDIGKHEEAKELFQEAGATYAERFDEEHPHTLVKRHMLNDIYMHMGDIYMQLGDWTKAGELYIKLIKTRTRALNTQHIDTIRSMVIQESVSVDDRAENKDPLGRVATSDLFSDQREKWKAELYRKF